MVKNPPAIQEIWVQSLGREDPLEREMATHSSILAWELPWTEESGGLQSMGSQRIGHDWVTNTTLALGSSDREKLVFPAVLPLQRSKVALSWRGPSLVRGNLVFRVSVSFPSSGTTAGTLAPLPPHPLPAVGGLCEHLDRLLSGAEGTCCSSCRITGSEALPPALCPLFTVTLALSPWPWPHHCDRCSSG